MTKNEERAFRDAADAHVLRYGGTFDRKIIGQSIDAALG